MHTRRPAERIDFQPGVFRDRELAGRARVVLRLRTRVLLERSSRLIGRHDHRPSIERRDLDVRAVEHAANLLDFVRVRRRNEQPHAGV